MDGFQGSLGGQNTAAFNGQRGITGLETAIVLIAFVVVASVFAFAVLTTGLVTSEKSKETIIGGLAETSATIVLRGSVLALSTTTPNEIDHIRFQVTNATLSGEAVNLSTSGLGAAVLSYIDDNQSVNLSNATWSATWLSGTGPLLSAGETVEIDADISGLATKLSTSTRFSVQLKPTVGAVLKVSRITPLELTGVMDLN